MVKKPVEDIVLRTRSRTKQTAPTTPISEMVPGIGLKTPEHETEKEKREDKILETLFNKKERLQSPRKSLGPWSYGAFGFLALIIVGYGVLSFMASAEVVIIPRNEEREVSLSVEAAKGNGGDITYTISNKSLTVEGTLPSKGIKEIDKRASGKIRIFNEYSTSPQKLISRTRFETKDGLVYRIGDALQVPGMSKKSGTNIPGSVEAIVFADEPGEKYNIPLSDFTIPGLKGTPTYTGLFARGVTPITGGFSGKVNSIDENELELKRTELEKDLQEKLIIDEEALPVEAVAFPAGLFLDYSEILDDEARAESGNPVPFKITGELNRVLLSRQELVKHIITSLFPNVTNSPSDIHDIENLVIEIQDKDLITNPNTAENIKLSIHGKVRFVWSVPENTIKEKLVGIKKDDAALAEVFRREFPNILKVQVKSVYPFWAHTFPDNVADITVKEVFNESEI